MMQRVKMEMTVVVEVIVDVPFDADDDSDAIDAALAAVEEYGFNDCETVSEPHYSRCLGVTDVEY